MAAGAGGAGPVCAARHAAQPPASPPAAARSGHLCISFELLGANLYEQLKANNFRGAGLPMVCRVAQQVLATLRFLARCAPAAAGPAPGGGSPPAAQPR